VVNIAGQNQVQIVRNGQSTMLSIEQNPTTQHDLAQDSGVGVYVANGSLSGAMQNVLDGFVLAMPEAQTEQTRQVAAALSGTSHFPLKISGLKFKTERMPLGTDALLAVSAERLRLANAN